MDVASLLTGLLPMLGVCVVCAIAFRRRHRGTFPIIMNPYTMAVEPKADSLGTLPLVQPMPPTTTSQKIGLVPTETGSATAGSWSADGRQPHPSRAATAPPQDLRMLHQRGATTRGSEGSTSRP